MIGRRRRTASGEGPAPTAVRDPLAGWTACLPDRMSGPLWAEPFADDLEAACTRAFEAFAPEMSGDQGTNLTLPISVPFDEHGVVVLSSAPPKPDAPRVPAELQLVAGSTERHAPYRYGLALARADGQALLVPGMTAAGSTDPLPLTLLTFAVTDRGMAIAGYDVDGHLAALDLDETTARALAVALLITIGVKLTKAGYSG